MKVLIADDEQDMLRIFKAYFEKEGFEVFLAKMEKKKHFKYFMMKKLI